MRYAGDGEWIVPFLSGEIFKWDDTSSSTVEVVIIHVCWTLLAATKSGKLLNYFVHFDEGPFYFFSFLENHPCFGGFDLKGLNGKVNLP